MQECTQVYCRIFSNPIEIFYKRLTCPKQLNQMNEFPDQLIDQLFRKKIKQPLCKSIP